MSRLAKDQKDVAKKMYKDGYCIGQIATYFSVAHTTAKKAVGATLHICAREHEEARKKFHSRKYKTYSKLTESLRKSIVQDYILGMSYSGICRKHDVSVNVVNRALHTYAAAYNVTIPMRRGGVSTDDVYGHAKVAMNLRLAEESKPCTRIETETVNKSSFQTPDEDTDTSFLTTNRKDMDAYWEVFIANMRLNPYR